jgi:hypothetical protein
MKRILLQGSKFLLATLMSYVLVFFALVHVRFEDKPLVYRTNDYYQSKGGVSYTKFQDWAKEDTCDVIVIGSSHAYRGYDPRVFERRGYRMFNMGSSAQSPLSTFAVVEGYLTKERAPLLIIDAYENAFDHPGVESVSDLTRNMDSDRSALLLAASFRDLRGLNMFTLRMLDKGSPPSWAHKEYIGNGAAISPDSALTTVKYPKPRGFQMNHRQLDRFLDCLDLCRERGIRVVLASHFYPQQGELARHAAFKTMMDSVLLQRGHDLDWFDLAETPGIDDHDHFCDHNHLNEAGARLFGEMLVDSLVAHGYLTRR